MPLTKIPFKPGVVREVTDYANEGGYYYSNLIRFRMGFVEKIGGWINTSPGYTYPGVTYSMANWITAKGENLIGFGTTQGFFVQNGVGTAYHDITPTAQLITLAANSFQTAAVDSPVLNIYSPSNALDVGTRIYFAPASGTSTSMTIDGVTVTFGDQTVVGAQSYTVIGVTGNINQYVYDVTASGDGATTTLTGVFTVVPALGTSITVYSLTVDSFNGVYEVLTSSGTQITYSNTTTGTATGGTVAFPTDSYQIIGSGNAITGGVYGGISVKATYLVNSGTTTTEAIHAWGIGTWGLGRWGVGVPQYKTYTHRIWSQASFGDDLILSIQGEPIYYWVKSTVNWTPATTLAAYAVTQNYQTTTTTDVGGVFNSNTFTVAFNDYIYPGEVISFASGYSGSIPAGTTVVSIIGLTVTVSNPVSIPYNSVLNLSYSGLYVPTQTNKIFVSPIYQFVIALGSNPYDPANANSDFDPLLIRWSDQTVPSQWIPQVSNQSGEQSVGNGSKLVTAVNNRQEILVYTDTALYSMQYIGAPYVFSFTLLQDNLSIISQNGAITANNITWWMGIDKFYAYSGTVQVLPCSVRRYVFSNINKTRQWQIVAGYNEGFSEVWWFYPSTNSTVNDSYIKFNFLDNVWDYGSMNRTAWLGSALQKYPLAAYSTQITYLTADVDDVQIEVTVADASTYMNTGVLLIGSELIFYTGINGNTFTGCIRGAYGSTATSHSAYTPVRDVVPNQIAFHEYGVDNNLIENVTLPILSFIQSSDIGIGDGHHLGSLWRMVPDLTFVNSTSMSPVVSMTVYPRLNSGSNYSQPFIPGVDQPTVIETVPSPPPPAVYPVEQFTGQIYTRVRGRQFAYRVDTGNVSDTNLIFGFPTSAVGVNWQLGVMRFDIRPDGRR
jgi:hypothetical protein